jgi:hypothetical protein
MKFPKELMNAGRGRSTLRDERRHKMIEIHWKHRPEDSSNYSRQEQYIRASFKGNKALKKEMRQEFGNPLMMWILQFVISAIINAIIKRMLER